MQSDKILYENIKKRRKELNMSQQELAEAVGYKGKSMISQVENGQIDLPITMVKKFAEVLQVDAGDLMGWEEFDIVHDDNVIFSKNERERRIIKMLQNSTPEIQSAVELLLKSSQQPSEPHQKN